MDFLIKSVRAQILLLYHLKPAYPPKHTVDTRTHQMQYFCVFLLLQWDIL